MEEEERYLRNVSQQCSLECSSEMESAQMASERSEHNLSDIGEMVVARSNAEIIRRYSVNETDICQDRKFDRSSRSGSLYSLPQTDRSFSSRSKSCRSSLNDSKNSRGDTESRQLSSPVDANFDRDVGASVSIPLVRSDGFSYDYKGDPQTTSSAVDDGEFRNRGDCSSDCSDDSTGIDELSAKKETSV